MDSMIKSVVRVFKFDPEKIGNLFIDEIDYLGLVYWFNDSQEYVKEISKAGNLGGL